MAIVYGLKVNLSVAMVAMLNHTALAEQAALIHHDSEIAVAADPVCQGSNRTEVVEVKGQRL
jgi:MFS transporter, ACS family, solute carrier family 17 (sodium-dependent inorganic phosphate cotransporter), other